jgi:hypothetical protein
MEDVIGTHDETLEGTTPLLAPVLEEGKLVKAHPTLEEIRQHFAKRFQALDEAYKALDGPPFYPVKLSPRLSALQKTASS